MDTTRRNSVADGAPVNLGESRPAAHGAPPTRLLTLSALALAAGVAVYLSGRAPGSSPAALGWLPPIAGSWPLLGQVPSLLHAFAFTLLTTAVLGSHRVLTAALLWAGIDTAFELAQHPAAAVIGARVGGTFDLWDLAAVAAGAALALLIVRGNDRRNPL